MFEHFDTCYAVTTDEYYSIQFCLQFILSICLNLGCYLKPYLSICCPRPWCRLNTEWYKVFMSCFGIYPSYECARGYSHWHGICICACLLGHFFADFGIAIGGFSSQMKAPNIHKLGIFWANDGKKHPILAKLGVFFFFFFFFLSDILMGGKWGQN